MNDYVNNYNNYNNHNNYKTAPYKECKNYNKDDCKNIFLKEISYLRGH